MKDPKKRQAMLNYERAAKEAADIRRREVEAAQEHYKASIKVARKTYDEVVNVGA